MQPNGMERTANFVDKNFVQAEILNEKTLLHKNHLPYNTSYCIIFYST